MAEVDYRWERQDNFDLNPEMMRMQLLPRDFEEAKTRAVTWLTAWDSQGPHRTGTASDEAGARWLSGSGCARRRSHQRSF